MAKQDIINQRLENHSDRINMLQQTIERGFEQNMQALAKQREQFDSEMREQREQNADLRDIAASMLQVAERIEAQTADNAERLTAIEIQLDRLAAIAERNASTIAEFSTTARQQATTADRLAGMVERLLERN